MLFGDSLFLPIFYDCISFLDPQDVIFRGRGREWERGRAGPLESGKYVMQVLSYTVRFALQVL